MKKTLFTLVGFLVLTCVWYFSALRPVDADSSDRTSVAIESGSSTSDIAAMLDRKGIVRSGLAFRLYTRFNGLDGRLQAGKFVLSSSMPLAEVAGVLHTGKAEELIVTIPEGYTVADIDALLAKMGLAEPGDVIDCSHTCDFVTYDFLPQDISGLAERGGRLEGYLFPDTYFVDEGEFVVKFFLERMLNAFRRNVTEHYAERLEDAAHTLHQYVTMASLIEEETRTDDERGVVAGILWKRYNYELGLGVDATVRYILKNATGAITHGDLNTNSPYNTRKFRGLPPGPIANPGAASLKAALYPKQSTYWYYLHAPDGQIHYAENNNEHNANRVKYLKKQ